MRLVRAVKYWLMRAATFSKPPSTVLWRFVNALNPLMSQNRMQSGFERFTDQISAWIRMSTKMIFQDNFGDKRGKIGSYLCGLGCTRVQRKSTKEEQPGSEGFMRTFLIGGENKCALPYSSGVPLLEEADAEPGVFFAEPGVLLETTSGKAEPSSVAAPTVVAGIMKVLLGVVCGVL